MMDRIITAQAKKNIFLSYGVALDVLSQTGENSRVRRYVVQSLAFLFEK